MSLDYIVKFLEVERSACGKCNKTIKERHYSSNIDELCTILQHTSFITVPEEVISVQDLKMQERVHCILNDITAKQMCTSCGVNEVRFFKEKDAYAERCGRCVGDSYRKKLGLKTSSQLITEIEHLGYEVLNFPYSMNTDKLIVKCRKCGSVNMHTIRNGNLHHIERMRLCKQCDAYVSSDEKRIRDFIMTELPDEAMTFNDRNIISPYEIDIVLQHKKLAIEYDGFYWHSADVVKSNYHSVKLRKCNKIGFDLVNVF